MEGGGAWLCASLTRLVHVRGCSCVSRVALPAMSLGGTLDSLPSVKYKASEDTITVPDAMPMLVERSLDMWAVGLCLCVSPLVSLPLPFPSSSPLFSVFSLSLSLSRSLSLSLSLSRFARHSQSTTWQVRVVHGSTVLRSPFRRGASSHRQQ